VNPGSQEDDSDRALWRHLRSFSLSLARRTEDIMERHPVHHPSVLAIAALLLLISVLSGCAFLVREATAAYMNANAQFSPKEIEIEIQRSFLEWYKDRVSIHVNFTVDKAMQNPVARVLDGDLHIAGRAPEIALPVVAEISNASSQKAAADLIHGAEGTGRPLKISGVWRIWPEHAGKAVEEQGKPLEAADSDDPGHVFEIHPITRINDLELLDTFRPVEGFMPGDARVTFGVYEKAPCTLTVKPKTISIVTQKGLYNDVEFLMEITEDRQIEAPGGRFVIASARDLKGDVLVERLRIVFVKDTPPEKAVKLLRRGDRLKVYGMPRVDFAEVSRRARNSQTDPALLVKPLPYEIIILGVYKDAK
jgi:hypothetical protein